MKAALDVCSTGCPMFREQSCEVLEWARDKQPKLLEQQRPVLLAVAGLFSRSCSPPCGVFCRLRKAKDFESFDQTADAAAACRVMAQRQAVFKEEACGGV